MTSQLDAIITHLSQKAIELSNSPSPCPRLIVALVGVPASGKTTLAKLLSEQINKKCKKSLSTVLPMDGFHLTRHTLTHRFVGDGEEGRDVGCYRDSRYQCGEKFLQRRTMKQNGPSDIINNENSPQNSPQNDQNSTQNNHNTENNPPNDQKGPTPLHSRNFQFELEHPYSPSTQEREECVPDDQIYCIGGSDGEKHYKKWPGSTESYAKRGAPFTFDPFLLTRALTNIKYHHWCPVSAQVWPGWDHGKKDPGYGEGDRCFVGKDITVVILEGLYLLLDVEPWGELLHGTGYAEMFPIEVRGGDLGDLGNLGYLDQEGEEKKDSELFEKDTSTNVSSTTQNNLSSRAQNNPSSTTQKNSSSSLTTTSGNLPFPFIQTPLIDIGIILSCNEELTIERGSVRNWKAGITNTLEESIERWKENDIKNGQFLMKHLNKKAVNWTVSQEEMGVLLEGKNSR